MREPEPGEASRIMAMSKNSDTDVFLKTSFLYGGNATYLEDLQSKFEQDPASVDSGWRSFFAGLKEERGDAIKNARGASWKKPHARSSPSYPCRAGRAGTTEISGHR